MNIYNQKNTLRDLNIEFIKFNLSYIIKIGTNTFRFNSYLTWIGLTNHLGI